MGADPRDRSDTITVPMRGPRDRSATETGRLREAEQARLDAATALLEHEIENARRCDEAVQQADQLSTDGVVLEPLQEEDTLVRHVRAVLHDLAG